MKLFYESKLKTVFPKDAEFYLKPFKGDVKKISPIIIEKLPSPKIYKPISRKDYPSHNQWKGQVHKALKLIEEKKIQKIVLARKTVIDFSEEIDPLKFLSAIPSKTSSRICIQLTPKDAFISLTPEMLFHRNLSQVTVDCIAGTKTNGSFTNKESLELDYVKQYVLSLALNDFAKVSPISELTTSNVQHLYQSISFPSNLTDLQLIELLHPTPAVCGLPKEKVINLLSSFEPFERNLYSGVFGWTTKERSEWNVLIRCCEISENKATFYTGVGIVTGSDPEKEWEELEAKLQLYSMHFR